MNYHFSGCLQGTETQILTEDLSEIIQISDIESLEPYEDPDGIYPILLLKV